MSNHSSSVLLESIITEKSSALSQHNKYTFKVTKSATKSQIRNAFEQVFPGRKVLAIRTLKIKGHRKRTKSGYTLPKDGKKAVVTAEGAKIEYFPEIS